MTHLYNKLKCLLGFHDWWYMDELYYPDGSILKEAHWYCMHCDKEKK